MLLLKLTLIADRLHVINAYKFNSKLNFNDKFIVKIFIAIIAL